MDGGTTSLLFRLLKPNGYGYSWSAPDPGQEEARYGDKLICGLTRWPRTNQPLGSGWHVGL